MTMMRETIKQGVDQHRHDDVRQDFHRQHRASALAPMARAASTNSALSKHQRVGARATRMNAGIDRRSGAAMIRMVVLAPT